MISLGGLSIDCVGDRDLPRFVWFGLTTEVVAAATTFMAAAWEKSVAIATNVGTMFDIKIKSTSRLICKICHIVLQLEKRRKK